MHAYLVITGGEETVREKIAEIVPDMKWIIPFTVAKIADARELIALNSTTIAEKTVYLLNDFDKASMEAQNAFLKSLEEAQENLIYVLTAKSEGAVLPTILSRCQVIRLKPHSAKASRVGVRVDFEAISKISKREEALEYLEGVIENERERLAENRESLKIVKAANEAYSRIQKNANPTIQLSWFVTQVL